MSCTNGQTIINYGGTALPAAVVDLFDSSVAFPGGCFHLLGQQWFQYTVFFNDAGALTGVVIGQYSIDKGVTWNTFYTSPTYAKAVENEDEVYVGMFKDIRFRFTPSAATTTFRVAMALNCHKPTSKAHPIGDPITTADVIGGNV
jgi:hypothetical protein